MQSVEEMSSNRVVKKIYIYMERFQEDSLKEYSRVDGVAVPLINSIYTIYNYTITDNCSCVLRDYMCL